MPKYNPSADESELYDEVKPPAESAGKSPTESESVDEEMAEGSTAVVPNKVLTGPDGEPPKEGDEIVLKVIKNYGDESEVAYAPSKPAEPSQMSEANDELDAMDKEMM